MNVLVAVEKTNYSFDKEFLYFVPQALECESLIGRRVLVPFGAGNKTRVALVMAVDNSEIDNKKIKPISSIIDPLPVLSGEMISLARFMKERYFCTFFDAVKLMLPAGLSYKVLYNYSLLRENFQTNTLTAEQAQIIEILKNAKKAISSKELFQKFSIDETSKDLKFLVDKGYLLKEDFAKRKLNDATRKMVKVIEDIDTKLSPKQQSVYDALMDIGEVSVKELMYFTGVGIGVIKSLVSKGCAELFEEEVYRRPVNVFDKSYADTGISLSDSQAKVFDDIIDSIEQNKAEISLLYGVTGSGKTSVFLKVIDYVLGKGKDVILMVPEIALTPQTIDVFRKEFGDNIAVFHSALSVGERLDEWKRVQKGECKLVIGTRSAIFAPFKNLGLVVIDEEQEHTYKSETSPRYSAKDIAKFRISYNKCLCILSSATPALESYYMVTKGVYSFHKLEDRYGGSTIPDVELVDMNEENLFGNDSNISYALKKALNDNFLDKKQSIILLNRRGFNSYIKCKTCNNVLTCPSCSISLTYHNANNKFMCHYCGHSTNFTTKCPTCELDTLHLTGTGTQKMELNLEEIVEGARVLRLDADTTSSKYAMERKMDAFARGEYDIMVGTQMVAKGLNFENVTLVGVISADQSLLSDDYRSNERTFDLLTQVVGRAGRGKYKGKAIIQTSLPENMHLQLSAKQDYFAFYQMEIVYRMAMLYPPFVDILVMGFVGEDERQTAKASVYFLNALCLLAQKEYEDLPLRVLQPSAANIVKISDKYRYKIIIKHKNSKKFREMIDNLILEYYKQKEFKNVSVFADPNPYMII